MPNSNHAKHKHITIIGGGAAGMTAAISAARNVGGNNVRIIEKNNKLGRKLLATGNGRCNYTNAFCTSQHLNNNSSIVNSEQFSDRGLSIFGMKDTLNFFEEIGVLAREEAEGRIYPYSEQASAVQEALIAELEQLGVDILYSSTVKQVRKLNEEGFEIILESGEMLGTQKLILATGGKAGPQYGSTGDGYQIAKSLNHTIIKPIPALVQLSTNHKLISLLKGVRSKGKVTLIMDKVKEISSEIGEIQFTEDGISGICVFNLSRNIRLDNENSSYQRYTVKIDLCPEFDEEELLKKLINIAGSLKGRKKVELLNGILNKKLASVMIKEAGISESGIIEHLAEAELIKLTKLLKGWIVIISGTKGWKDAQVTSGGITTSEINGNTMESKRNSGLYFAGEIIDIDGKCGGYNLQWAWTSGYIAGKAACE